MVTVFTYHMATLFIHYTATFFTHHMATFTHHMATLFSHFTASFLSSHMATLFTQYTATILTQCWLFSLIIGDSFYSLYSDSSYSIANVFTHQTHDMAHTGVDTSRIQHFVRCICIYVCMYVCVCVCLCICIRILMIWRTQAWTHRKSNASDCFFYSS